MLLIDLPDDPLGELISRLGLRTRFLRLALVCRRFARLTASSPLPSLALGEEGLLKWPLERFIQERTLEIQKLMNPERTMQATRAAVQAWLANPLIAKLNRSSVKELSLDGLPFEIVDLLATAFPNVESLTFQRLISRHQRGEDYVDSEGPFLRFQKLKRLHFYRPVFSSIRLPNSIESITITGYQMFLKKPQYTYVPLFEQLTANLKKIDVFVPLPASLLNQCSQLTHLALAFNAKDEVNDFSKYHNPNLEVLTLRVNPTLSFSSNAPNLPDINRFSRLTSLNITEFPKIPWESVRFLSRLESLELFGFKGDKILGFFEASALALRKIHIHPFDHFCLSDDVTFLEKLPNLRELLITKKMSLHPSKLEALQKIFAQLEGLSLSFLASPTTEELAGLLKALDPTRIRYLLVELNDFPLVLMQEISRLQSLRIVELRVQDCEMDDDWILAGLRLLENLEHVTVVGKGQRIRGRITIEAIEQVIRGKLHLNVLYFQLPFNFTPTRLKEFALPDAKGHYLKWPEEDLECLASHLQ